MSTRLTRGASHKGSYAAAVDESWDEDAKGGKGKQVRDSRCEPSSTRHELRAHPPYPPHLPTPFLIQVAGRGKKRARKAKAAAVDSDSDEDFAPEGGGAGGSALVGACAVAPASAHAPVRSPPSLPPAAAPVKGKGGKAAGRVRRSGKPGEQGWWVYTRPSLAA